MYSSNKIGSIFRLLKQLGHIVKEKTLVMVGTVVEEYIPPVKVVISAKFFRSAGCKKCGKCCENIVGKGFSLVALSTDDIPRSSDVFVYTNHMTLPVPSLSVYFNRGEVCDFVKDSLCSIHDKKPVHCALPMVEVDKTKDRARLIKRPRGRNWRFGCPAEFRDFDYNEFLWDLANLKRLQEIAEYLKMNTWLPEIIECLDTNKEKYRTTIPDKSVIIFEKSSIITV